MKTTRFRFDRTNKEFNCYDCRNQMSVGSEFSWDNLRNCRICEPCLKKLSELLEDDVSANKKAAEAAIIKSDSERIQALEEQVTSLSQQVLHMKSLWYNEIRTYTRSSSESAGRKLVPSATNSTIHEGFTTPAIVLEKLEDVFEAKPEDEEPPF